MDTIANTIEVCTNKTQQKYAQVLLNRSFQFGYEFKCLGTIKVDRMTETTGFINDDSVVEN